MLCEACTTFLAGGDGGVSHSKNCQLWPFGFLERLNLLGRLDHPLVQDRLKEYRVWVEGEQKTVPCFAPLPIFGSLIETQFRLPSYFLPIDSPIFSFPENLDRFFLSWKDDQIGWGLFAREPLAKGEFIGLYGGKIRRLSLFDSHDRSYTAELLRPFPWTSPYVVDAKEIGNLFRYVNHSRTPNLGVVFVRQCSLPFLGLVAARSIEKGEELCLSYGQSFWKTGKKEQVLS